MALSQAPSSGLRPPSPPLARGRRISIASSRKIVGFETLLPRRLVRRISIVTSRKIVGFETLLPRRAGEKVPKADEGVAAVQDARRLT